MKPSSTCLKHYSRSIFNPKNYRPHTIYESLPFTPKSLLCINTPTRIDTASSQLLVLTKKYPNLQIVSVTLDMKYVHAIGEVWFDELIGIESMYFSNKLWPDDTKFSAWIHNNKIDLNLSINLHNSKAKLFYNMIVKNPSSTKFSNYLSHLEISLPFDEKTTKFQIKSQLKPLTPRLKITSEIKDRCFIKSFNNKNAFLMFELLQKQNEEPGKEYKYVLEISSLSKTERFELFPIPSTRSLFILNRNVDFLPNDKLYARILQNCVNDVKFPKVNNGLVIDCFDMSNTDLRSSGEDVVVENSVIIGSGSGGFHVDDVAFASFGDYVKVESVQ